MAGPPAGKPPAAKAVFINCAFDDDFKPILRAMVFTIILSGYHPRCALDANDGAEVRIGKIAKMIGECDWGIHDLSRVEVSPGGIPRFNMPTELGVHLGARLLGEIRHRRKRALILDAVPHRYDEALSDISGQDIETHDNKPEQAIRCVELALGPPPAQRRAASRGQCDAGGLSPVSKGSRRIAGRTPPRSARPVYPWRLHVRRSGLDRFNCRRADLRIRDGIPRRPNPLALPRQPIETLRPTGDPRL